MAFDTVNVGATANDGTGDTPRAGMQKVNSNFQKAVEGPASTVTNERLVVFDGTTGKLVKQGTKTEASLVVGPASATDGRVVVYDGTTGKLVKNGTKLEADVVTGPASVTTDRIALFDGTTGKLLKQATVLVSDLLPLSGGTMTGAITTNAQIVTTVTTLGTTGTLNLDMNASMLQTTGTLAGNITLTTSNRAAGKTVTLRIVNGGTNRTITWPAGWVFVGTAPASPETITANKTAVVTITAFGTADSDIVAAYAEQP